MEVIDLHLLIDALAEMLERTLGSRISVNLDLAAGDARIEVDPAELETAILNATINARDAMPDGGTLTISTALVEEGGASAICLAIADTGSGMPKDVLERAFEPFFTTKSVGKGTGLGLSQIHGFAAQAGGRAEVSSTLGEGTEVRVILPRCSKPLSAARDERETVVLPEGLRVLLVEDNAEIRIFAEQMLSDLRCTTWVAENAEEALNVLEEQEVDVVFTDIVMPGMSGVELAEALQRSKPCLPVVLATGYSRDVIGSDASRYEIVRKPYDAHSVTSSIAKVLRAAINRAV